MEVLHLLVLVSWCKQQLSLGLAANGCGRLHAGSLAVACLLLQGIPRTAMQDAVHRWQFRWQQRQTPSTAAGYQTASRRPADKLLP
jgi:hypothetical protein